MLTVDSIKINKKLLIMMSSRFDLDSTLVGPRGVCGAVQCGFGPFLAVHFAVRFS